MTDISKIDTDRINGLDAELEQIITTLSPRVSQAGDICYSLRSEKEGWLLCNGQAVSRTIYQELFATIGTTYGNGDGTTTFNVPDYRGKFLQMVSGSQTIGTELEAGLPNITGNFTYNAEIVNVTECFYDGGQANYSGGRTNKGISTVYFDASRSSSIYGNATTVQPPAFTVNYFIKF